MIDYYNPFFLVYPVFEGYNIFFFYRNLQLLLITIICK